MLTKNCHFRFVFMTLAIIITAAQVGGYGFQYGQPSTMMTVMLQNMSPGAPQNAPQLSPNQGGQIPPGFPPVLHPQNMQQGPHQRPPPMQRMGQGQNLPPGLIQPIYMGPQSIIIV